MEQVNCKFGAADAAVGQACGALELNFPAAPTYFSLAGAAISENHSLIKARSFPEVSLNLAILLLSCGADMACLDLAPQKRRRGKPVAPWN